ncbi:glycosyltransferase family 4 protein [Roseivirga misakiensis]|uniref:Glycosyl transferase family 1 n=1 Tax=Roseivirga misakiensis TaxID=1563681 RepID=A0A1E5T2N3_9BACT|nr:glycosyltransferase family 4 protein [Roseivirga misakiensis]OEK05648.1 hypothetical protein BFP71_17500 [Roseivirga misakiensis]
MQHSKKPKFLLIGGFASSLINFRGPLLRALTLKFDVYATAPFVDQDTRLKVEALGVTCISNNFERTGLNPIKDLLAFRQLKQEIRAIKPDYVLAYTIKPVIFGLMASGKKNVKKYALITGRGSGFDSNTFKAQTIRSIVKRLYKRSLSNVEGIIFQNSNDEIFFIEESIISKNANSTVIEGTGVDLAYYHASKSKNREDLDKIKFLFVARLIKEKGIPELFEATKQLKKYYDNFEVQLLGWVDPNPGGISKEEIEAMDATGVITYLGTTDDIRPFMDNADVFVLPTYYNEGLPRTIQEAMAMSKPIITTDHPGCRETVVEGENGFLVPTKNADVLRDRMEYFIKTPQAIRSMGIASLSMAREKFDVNKINSRIFEFMQLTNV